MALPRLERERSFVWVTPLGCYRCSAGVLLVVHLSLSVSASKSTFLQVKTHSN